VDEDKILSRLADVLAYIGRGRGAGPSEMGGFGVNRSGSEVM
jgi:hypothetical protein